MEVGLKSWSGLRAELLNRISREVDNTGSLAENINNYHELEELAKSSSKFWEFFSHAYNVWPTTYNDFMIDEFDNVVPKCTTPVIYTRLWKMRRTRQIFTLNVDGLVARSFREIYPNAKGVQLLEFDGYSVSDSLSYLARDNYCVVNLHGTFTQKSRWIMNAEQRAQLLSGPMGEKYAAYIRRLFSEYNIVFIGMNPADVAISPFLTAAAQQGSLGNHYWICPNPTSEVVKWAQKQGVRLVAYQPLRDEKGIPVHTQDICGIIDQIESFSSKDERVELPQLDPPISPSNIPDPLQIIGSIHVDRVAARANLAGAISHIGAEYGYTSKELEKFLEKYNIPLKIASMIDENMPGFDKIGGYSIVQPIQNSGTSSVWLVEDTTKEEQPYFALKSLSPDSITSLVTRQSFRRGIESLYLLSGSNSKVAPKYISHSELPLSVVMEFIEGSTLEEFLNDFPKLDEKIVVDLFIRVCDAVRKCHVSEGKVLHRDVKPGNIMLEAWHSGYPLQDVLGKNIRLINFDLSWHRFTSGDTKSISAEDIGYYSPEQRNSANSMPPRSAETDVYMLGMVLYFMCSRKAPPDGGAGLTDWPTSVRKAVRSVFKDDLIRERVQRLIADMTHVAMEDRIDLSNVIAEAEGVHAWITKNIAEIDNEYIVENLAVAAGRAYDWDKSAMSASIRSTESTDLRITYRQKGQKAIFEFMRQKSSADNRATFGPKMAEKISNAGTILQNFGWDILQKDSRGMSAEIRINNLRQKNDFGVGVWKNACDLLLASFD